MAIYKTSNDRSFEDYRRQMHPEEEEAREVVPTPHRAVAIGFGIFMIIVYVGMGVALFMNAFGWDAQWAWIRYLVGAMLVLYGIFRSYRYIINYKK